MKVWKEREYVWGGESKCLRHRGISIGKEIKRIVTGIAWESDGHAF